MNTDEIRKKCGSANKNKVFSEVRRKNMSNAILGHVPYFKMTDDIRAKIGIGSREKFTNEYNIKMRNTMELLGKWIPMNKKNEYSVYAKLANWKHKMFDLSYIENSELLRFGVFNNKTNILGIVRDHMYSRKSGFENMVFPEILRHPCNCRLITHSDNTKFAHSNVITDDYITVDILFERIIQFEHTWDEHELCLSLIAQYKNGKRFDLKKYIENYGKK